MSEINTTSIKNKLNNIANGITASMYSKFSLVEWRPLLAKECQVYVCGETYLAKRFDQIHFQFCTKDIAKEILIDNLYALLRFKYFPKSTDEIEEKIKEIVKSFTENLKTVLIRVSFDQDAECEKVSHIPDGCVAFRNGVYDFRNNRWLFEYDKILIPKLSNIIYLYNPKYIITWYININFQPLDININETDFIEFIELVKTLDKDNKNYCFELMYNMSHDIEHKFSQERFNHLCEILGYTCLQSFTQLFEIFVGSGQNGKNSLFDGCFTSRVVPSPANVSMSSFATDVFLTGSLENRSHNFYFETEAETIVKSEQIKQVTGSPYQYIHHKGEDKYSGMLNVKNIWSANDQDKLKFSDTTIGFRRRINIFEVYFRWDARKRFLEQGDYYDTTFSDDLIEIKKDLANTIMFIYFAMYGIKLATKDFQKKFEFTKNDWKLQYTDIDFDLKEKVDNISQDTIANWFTYPRNKEAGRIMFYDLNRKALHLSDTMKEYGIHNYDEYIENFIDNEDGNDLFMNYFAEHDVYMGIKFIQELSGNASIAKQFTQEFKKTYDILQLKNLTGNKAYVKVTFRNNKLKIIG